MMGDLDTGTGHGKKCSMLVALVRGVGTGGRLDGMSVYETLSSVSILFFFGRPFCGFGPIFEYGMRTSIGSDTRGAEKGGGRNADYC